MDRINQKTILLCGGRLLLLTHAAAAFTPSLDLLLEGALTFLFDLEGVDVLNQDTLVPEFVTLGLKVKLAIEVLVDFLLLPEVNECAADDTDTTDPLPFVVEPCVLGTTALTETPVTTGALCKNPLPVAGLGVHADWAAIDDAVADQLADLLAGVRHCDRGCFGFVHPDAAKATSENGRGKTLLQFQRRHRKRPVKTA